VYVSTDSSVCFVVKAALIGYHRQALISRSQATTVSSTPRTRLSVRHFAAAKVAKKGRKDQKEEKSKVEKEKKVDNTNRHTPFGLTAWEPIDDVYRIHFYPKPVHEIETALDMLKKFQEIERTCPNQAVYIDLKLDMKLEKKKKVDPFVSIIQMPYPFKTEENKVLVFTENAEEAKVAEANGAAFVGGSELVQKILDDELEADFYVAVPEIVPKLIALKNKLRKKFPKSKRGSVGRNIHQMLQQFKIGHEYLVDRECYIQTKIATLDMPKDQILANVATLIKDVCTHRLLNYGPFIERGIICSATSEALQFKVDRFLPQTEEEEKGETD
uniref:Large ribosomal subunit protein uL1m n=1 Tax=Latimeria chalumnae TaxID=7897 RepID=H3AI35_LATCH